MSEFKAHGSFCWTDLISTNVSESRSFYANVFGWHFQEVRAGDESENVPPYTMGYFGEKEVTGVVAPDFEVPNSHWATYFYTEDLDASIEKAKELGATTHLDKKVIPEWGSLAVLEDTSGGVFSLWNCSRGGMQKPYTDGTFGRFCWTELMTTNVEAAGKFYCDMFGWTPEHMTNADGGDYFIFKNGENMNCGMMEINPKEMGEMTSHWLNYVAVDSASQTLKRVEDNGGKKVWGTQYMENVGHLAVFIDPHGAAVGIVGEVE